MWASGRYLSRSPYAGRLQVYGSGEILDALIGLRFLARVGRGDGPNEIEFHGI
ncbi:hypothetical protein ZHAS_00020836 [Anopheles sinensis]|uniref:Uncharacterized protein n=1 Tax=Anopheles sinensis TaxID=74873 RepID=A0A084WQS4_ANOSI|nr:hypothetical protein ZHAS_00020836 [Anopheles sinensis]